MNVLLQQLNYITAGKKCHPVTSLYMNTVVNNTKLLTKSNESSR